MANQARRRAAMPGATRRQVGSAVFRRAAIGLSTALMTMAVAVTAAADLPATPAAKPAARPVVHAIVEQPRAYGHTIGDLMQQRIARGTPAAPFLLAEVPRIGRVGASLWRRRSDEQIDARGQHWLTIEYQLINTPQSLSVWYLPVLKLRAKNDSAVLTVDAAPFSIGPTTPPQPYEVAALPALQLDAAPAPVATGPLERRIRLAARALAAIVLVWAGLIGWRHLRRGRHLPFARALQDLRRLQPGGGTQAADPLAARRRLLHALNDTAGEVVRPATVGRLLARAPYLAPEQAALASFVQESHAVFFGGQAVTAQADTADVGQLARRLRRLERRHAG
jgi:mxaA protein